MGISVLTIPFSAEYSRDGMLELMDAESQDFLSVGKISATLTAGMVENIAF